MYDFSVDNKQSYLMLVITCRFYDDDKSDDLQLKKEKEKEKKRIDDFVQNRIIQTVPNITTPTTQRLLTFLKFLS